jgi:hypothetical protein
MWKSCQYDSMKLELRLASLKLLPPELSEAFRIFFGGQEPLWSAGDMPSSGLVGKTPRRCQELQAGFGSLRFVFLNPNADLS